MTEIELELEDRILEHVGRENYLPVKPRVIAKKLGMLAPADLVEVRRTIKKLVRKKRLRFGAKHFVMAVENAAVAVAEPEVSRPEAVVEEAIAEPTPPKQKALKKEKPAKKAKTGPRPHHGGVIGVFQRKAAGFGFVRTEGGTREDDIFVPAGKASDAANGDLVEVRARRSDKRDEKRVRGEIVRVVQRATHLFVGQYFEAGSMGFVNVDGDAFSQPIYVGDPGAKNSKTDDMVVFEMVRFPTLHRDGEGVITKVLGPRGTPGVDTQAIICEYALPQEFPEDVLESAREQAEKFDEENLEGRLDLTDEVIITIDPVDARDFDDAISLTRIENGHWKLGVHIADVSHFVPRNSALDREARERATSVYLPDQVIPMLPEIISNNLASLQPDHVRFAKSVIIEFTPDGARVATEVRSAAIKSRRRFTYEEVDDFLDNPESWRTKITPEVFELLEKMHELAMILRKRRVERGAIELDLRDVELELDKDGKVSGAHLVENTISHKIIEECMLAANEAVAQNLIDNEWLFLRRVHENPDPRKLQKLTEFVEELGIETEGLESRFEIQRVIDEMSEKPESRAVNYAVLRTMQKAEYGPQEEGHFALAAPSYCHFTSPIRRYPDLTVHRLVETLERGENPRQDLDALKSLGNHCSGRERRAEEAERELTKVKLLGYLEDHIGTKMEAVITGVQDFGIFAQGLDMPAEGLISIASLDDDFYTYEETSHSLVGKRADNRYRLGDHVVVQVKKVDIERRELYYHLVEHTARPGGVEANRKLPKVEKKPSKAKLKREKRKGGKKGKRK